MTRAIYARGMVAARRGLSRRMVGRGALLEELGALLRDASSADVPTVAMVTGEAGVGKTRLLRELLADAADDVTVVTGQARETEAGRSFALLRDAVEEHLDPAVGIPEELERWRHPLGHLLEPLVVVHDHPRDGHEHKQEEFARAGVALLRHLTETGPALVAFEDLHWADAESLEVLARLARSDAPLLLLGTFRSEEYDRRHPLAELLAELEHEGTVSHLAVEGLSRRELSELLEEVTGQPAAAGTVERLHRRTRGNPFFLEELLAAVTQPSHGSGQRSPDAASLDEAPLPWSTSEAVLRRLERFDEAVRRLVRTAAVLGDPFDTTVLASVLGEQVVDALLPMLARLVRDGVLVEQTHIEFAFRHALTREAASSELLESEKRAVHSTALDVLRARESVSPATLAHHALAAGRRTEAAEHARTAALAASHTGTPREALALARVATDNGSDDVGLYELAATAAGHLGEFADGIDHARHWQRLAVEADDPAGEARARARLAWLYWWAGDREASWETLREAIPVVEAMEPCAAQVEVLVAHARFLMLSKRPGEAVARANQAIAAAEQIRDQRAIAKAWLYKAAGMLDSLDHQRAEDLELAASLIDRARMESSRLGDPDTLAGALYNRLAPDQPDDLPIERMWQLLAEAKDVADRYGIELLMDKTTLLETHLAVLDGDLERAEQSLSRARRANMAAVETSWREALEALVAMERGDLEVADAAHSAQLELLRQPCPAECEVDSVLVAARQAAHRRDPGSAEAALRRIGQLASEVCPCGAANWWEVAIWGLDAGVAPTLVLELMDRDAPVPIPRYAGLVEHMHGVLHAAEGDPGRAIEALQRSLEHERRHRRAALLADVHRRLAELLGAQGQRQQAHEHVTAGLALLERWPGTSRTRLEALQRRLGDDDGPAHELFTPRELEVVKLVARGYTNSDIAERLFITRKTAATHISNILSKTGFDRRTQVAIWAVQEGIAERVE